MRVGPTDGDDAAAGRAVRGGVEKNKYIFEPLENQLLCNHSALCRRAMEGRGPHPSRLKSYPHAKVWGGEEGLEPAQHLHRPGAEARVTRVKASLPSGGD